MQRVRNISTGPTTFTEEDWYTNTKGVTTYGSYTYIGEDHYDVMSDVVTKNYKKRVANGEIIINPMYHLTRKMTQGGASYQWTSKTSSSKGGRSNWNMTAANLPVAYDSQTGSFLESNRLIDYDKHISLAKQKAIADIDSTPQRMMEDFFELKKTVALLDDPLTVARDVTNKFARKRNRLIDKGLDAFQATAQAWLGTKYAYGSLVYSMMSIHDLIRDNSLLSSRKYARLKATGFSRERVEHNGDISRVTGSIIRDYHEYCLDEYLAKAGIIYELRYYDPNHLPFKAGLRLKDVPRGIWNVLPYTWVTDRFVNVADTITGLMNLADPKVRILGAYSSFDHYGQHDIGMTGFTNPSVNLPSWVPDVIHNEFESHSRTPWSPSASDTLPTLDVSNVISDFSKTADLAALIVGKLRIPKQTR